MLKWCPHKVPPSAVLDSLRPFVQLHLISPKPHRCTSTIPVTMRSRPPRDNTMDDLSYSHALPLRQQHAHASSDPDTSTILLEGTGESFQYTALQHPDSIRLLKVEPSVTGAGAVYGSFLDLTLLSKPAYEVLSGFWGGKTTSSRLASLIIDGKNCKATPELVQALIRSGTRTDRGSFGFNASASISVIPTSGAARSGCSGRSCYAPRGWLSGSAPPKTIQISCLNTNNSTSI